MTDLRLRAEEEVAPSRAYPGSAVGPPKRAPCRRRPAALGVRPDRIGVGDHPSRVRLPSRRRPADVLRFVLGAAVLAVAGVEAHLGHPSILERNLFRLVNQLPSTLEPPLLGIMQLGAVAAVPLVALLALVGGRPRLARVVAIAGGAAWTAAKLVQFLVDEEPASVRLPRVVLHGAVSPGPAFPASHVAVAVAVVTVAGPHVRDGVRRAGWLVVAFIAVARMYVGIHLPVDILGGLALGWMVGAAVNLVAGAPSRTPAPDLIGDLLREVGVRDATVWLDTQGRYRATTSDGDGYLVEVISSDHPDQDWLYRLWRLAAYHELRRPTAPITPAHRVAQEAHLNLAAERAGVRTPSLVATSDLGDDTSVLVRRWVPATPLTTVPNGAVTDAVLVDAWIQLAAAHAGGISIRGLSPEHLLLGYDGQVWLVGWGAARASTCPDDRDADVAELLVGLASRAGTTRAVRTAVEVLGRPSVSAALPHLRPLALAPCTRALTVDHPALVSDLMVEVAALDGRALPPAASPGRVIAGNLVPLAALAAAVYVLLPRLAEVPESKAVLAGVRWPWLLIVVAASGSTYFLAALGLRAASGRRLPPAQATAAQLAAAASNRVLPAGLGAIATNIRYLECSGAPRTEAVAAVVATSASGFVVHAVGGLVAFAAVRHGPALPRIPSPTHSWPALVGLAAISAVVGLALSTRQLRSLCHGWIRVGGRNLAAVVARPRQAVLVLAANAGITAAYVVAFDAALRAFGVHLSLPAVAAVYIGGSAVGSVTAAPGGVGPFEAAAVAGLGGFGVAAAPAVAAVIVYRIITYWLPIAPGAVAFHLLRRRRIL